MQVEGSSKDKKVLQVSTSALVGLKAALYSKQQAAQRQKHNIPTDSTHTRQVSEKTAAIWKRQGKKSKGQKPAADKKQDKVLSQEEENELEKSRRALEAKTALYERLSKGQGLREVEGQEGEESRYIVDFTRKIYDGRRDSNADSAVSHERSQLSPVEKSPSPEADEWVEYEDDFGRTRKCLKSELPDREKNVDRSPSPDLLSEDMRRERERVRWEREAEAEMELDKPVGPVHYQSVQGGEVRSHGVGYYQFSQSEEERQKQMDMLENLRTETSTERDKKARLQEKRKALLEARLAKVKERRNEQRRAQGLADIEFEIESKQPKEEPSKVNSTSDDIRALLDAELERSKVNSQLMEDRKDDEKRVKHVRPWDRGKSGSRPVMDPIKKRKMELEDERPQEFAPPTFYSDNTKTDKDTSKEVKQSASEVSASHANTSSYAALPPGSHGNTVPPWPLPPNFMPPPGMFPWQPPPYLIPPPPMPWGQYPPPPPPGPPPTHTSPGELPTHTPTTTQ